MKMLDVKDVPDDVDIIKEQIKIRHELMRNMVGSLYPGIVFGQICELNSKLSDLLRAVR